MYIVTKSEAKKQLQIRTKKEPLNYTCITIQADELPYHLDGLFWAMQIVLYFPLASKSHTIKHVHYSYSDALNVRNLEDGKLPPGSVTLQDAPLLVLDSSRALYTKQVKLETCNLKERE